MDFLIGVIDFSLTRFTHPLVIIGLIIIVLGLVTVICAKKFDSMIGKKVGNAENKNEEAEAFLGEIHDIGEDVENQNASLTDDVFDTGSETSNYGKEGSEQAAENVVNDESGGTVFRKKDGSKDYYYIFKIVGLIIVIAGCLMAAFG